MSINDVVTGLEVRADELHKNTLAELNEAQAYQYELDASDAQATQVENAIEDLNVVDEQVAVSNSSTTDISVDDFINSIDLDSLESPQGIQL